MKRLRLAAVLCSALMLSACAPHGMRMVDTKDDASFAAMYHAMKPAMLKKELVDAKGNWYAPVVSLGPEDAGMAFLNRLSPKFCNADLGEPAVESFRAMTTPEDEVKAGPWSASIRTQDWSLKLQLTAVTDWNGDGRDDWLVTCRLALAKSPAESKEYFLLFTDPEAGVLEPFVLMERRHVFSRVSVLADNSLTDFSGAVTVEVEQGQVDVTQAPKRGLQKFDSSKLKASSLSN